MSIQSSTPNSMNAKTSTPNDMNLKVSIPNDQRIPCRSSIARAVCRGKALKKDNASKSAQQSSIEKMPYRYRPP